MGGGGGGAPGPQSSMLNPGSDSKKSKTRTSITPQQLEVLMAVYCKEQRPSRVVREDLMAKTGLDMKVIQVWFQNRRSKEKRDGTQGATTTSTPTMKEEVGAAATPVASVTMALSTDEAATPMENFTPQSEGGEGGREGVSIGFVVTGQVYVFFPVWVACTQYIHKCLLFCLLSEKTGSKQQAATQNEVCVVKAML